MDEIKIKRINELYKKSKEVGLTDLELAEQARLRKEYIEAFRASTLRELERIYIKNEDGTVEKLIKD